MNMKANYPKHVNLIEVGPRDGFQFEDRVLPTEIKLNIETGVDIREVARCSQRPKVFDQYVDINASDVHPADGNFIADMSRFYSSPGAASNLISAEYVDSWSDLAGCITRMTKHCVFNRRGSRIWWFRNFAYGNRAEGKNLICRR
jgi:hypothetical protein